MDENAQKLVANFDENREEELKKLDEQLAPLIGQTIEAAGRENGHGFIKTKSGFVVRMYGLLEAVGPGEPSMYDRPATEGS